MGRGGRERGEGRDREGIESKKLAVQGKEKVRGKW